MNVWDVLILLGVAGLMYLAFRQLRGNRKEGRCSCGCSGCAQSCPRRSEEK